MLKKTFVAAGSFSSRKTKKLAGLGAVSPAVASKSGWARTTLAPTSRYRATGDRGPPVATKRRHGNDRASPVRTLVV